MSAKLYRNHIILGGTHEALQKHTFGTAQAKSCSRRVRRMCLREGRLTSFDSRAICDTEAIRVLDQEASRWTNSVSEG
jgi:hypothetical protein